jgi:phosphatidylglycerophosphate synthase
MNYMLTIPNILSFIRIPLALLFLQANPYVRAAAILLAMLSDGLDGFLARRYKISSRFGTVLDPVTDKFFGIFVLCVFILEKQLSFPEAAAILSRDFSILLFGCYLLLTQSLQSYRFRALWCGKITTFLQFIVFLALTFHFTIPPYVFILFTVLGAFAFIELIIGRRSETA